MSKTVFDYQDYKSYLRDFCDEEGRGYRKQLAEKANCQTAYISHVLNGDAHFSWEQAEAISSFVGHTALETEYFLYLVEFTRAGTRSLRGFLERKLNDLRNRHLTIKDRIQVKETLSREDQAKYYSAWYYAAIHVMLTLSSMQSVEAISRQLNLSARTVKEVLEFLCSVGMAIQDGPRFRPGNVALHLETDSPLISKHHTNWRLQATRALENQREGELHYSSVFTLSKEDAGKIRAGLVQEIERAVKRIKDSPEEVTCAMTVDFWEL